MSRSSQSNDARVLAKAPKKIAAAPVSVKAVVMATHPQADRCFQTGDIVSFRSNTRGIILAVTGNGVQVDFGLGAGWFSQETLTLIKAVSICK